MNNNRPNSPLSENTLLDHVRNAGLNIDSASENSDFVDISSESEWVDDTDEDPTYDPEAPGTSHGGRRPPVFSLASRPNREMTSESSSDDDDDIPSQQTRPSLVSAIRPTGNTSRGNRGCRSLGNRRGRPSGNRPRVVENEPESSSWDEVEEGNDREFPHSFNFSEISGPKHCPPVNSSPIEYFKLFFTTTLLTTMLTETNRYANKFVQLNRCSPSNRITTWVNITVQEMKAFIAIIMNMGMIRKPSIFSYWDTSFTQDTPWFRKMMTRTRFQMILKFFHIVDVDKLAPRGQQGYNPCGRFEPIIDHANRLFRMYYYPTQALSVDESLVGTKKKVDLTQYMPKKKHHKWGIKLWVLSDSVTRYCLAFYCYKGAKRNEEDQARVTETGLTTTVVLKLLEMGNYFNKGHHVFLDNFFTSISLARTLYEKMTFTTGTLRIDRKGIPKPLLGKYKVGQKTYVRKGPVLIMAHREKPTNTKQFLILSTDCKAETVRYTKRRYGQDIIKNTTALAHKYNMGMGGIDGVDQMLYVYLDERRTMKHAKKVIFNVFGRMILNSYILYKINTNEKQLPRARYMRSIIEELSREWLASKCEWVAMDAGGGGDSTRSVGLRKLPEKKEKLCKMCSGDNHPEGKKRRSRTICVRCEAGVHPECLVKHVCL